MKILFNPASIRGKEIEYIEEVIKIRQLSGDGIFTKKCSQLMEEKFNAKKVLLTTSCTHALEMAAILLNLKSGDEVIVPSYTYPTTVTSFCLRGAIPIFVDVREDTLNINEQLIEEKITDKTKAIFVVHYNGISCDMEKINDIAKRYNLFVVEDAAQGVNAMYNGKYLGTLGHLGTYSFHDTKNYVCGEGGALIINDEQFIERAEIIREKGTDRSKFLRGEIDKYTWVDIGSSYLPSDILAAFLFAQLEQMDVILNRRREIYSYYCARLRSLEGRGLLRLPRIPPGCQPNYHMFYIILTSEEKRNKLMFYLKEKDIQAFTHYHPLHDSKMGKLYGYNKGDLPVTESYAIRLLRLPFHTEMTPAEQDIVIDSVAEFFSRTSQNGQATDKTCNTD